MSARPTARGVTRRICFVTGTRAEFGLMAATLRAIRAHPPLSLQLIATGMHLDPAHGDTIDDIRRAGFKIDATVPWEPASPHLAGPLAGRVPRSKTKSERAAPDPATHLARQTGLATAACAAAFADLNPDVILVVGDRAEALAAATAAHLAGHVLAHVHGGDRALGQVDDALRHAITKLAHLHFPATRQSADRLLKLGEDKWRIRRVGSPGLDGITTDALPLDQCQALLGGMGNGTPLPVSPRRANHPGHPSAPVDPPALRKHRYALLVLHPTDPDPAAERTRANLLLTATLTIPFDHAIIVHPNNDPGSAGITAAWDAAERASSNRQLKLPIRNATFLRSLPRPAFLGLLRDAAVLIGNSSSGIIEAASFGTPVIDVGPRQAGRERGPNVITVPFTAAAIRRALKSIWNNGHPRRYPKRNPYGQGDTASKIAHALANIPLDAKLRRKLIAY